MALTQKQLKEREGKLTASAVAPLMTGDKTRIMNLWRQMIGDPDYARDDLSGVWPVQLGTVTEGLNLDWYERKTGQTVTRRGEVVIHPYQPWAAATLDGWIADFDACIEAKHVGGREDIRTVIARYMPQFHWQMIVTQTNVMFATIIEGANEPLIERIIYDIDYADELWRRAEKFMECVNTLTPPFEADPVAPPVAAIKTYDFTGNNEWADGAVTWLETFEAAKKAKSAETSLKGLVPADAKLATGHGIEITRDRAARLSLKPARKAA